MKIKAFRLELGYGIGDFARICGLYSREVTLAEKSKKQPPNHVLRKIMLAFNLPSGFFLTGDSEWKGAGSVKTDPVCNAIGCVDNQQPNKEV